MAGTKNHDYHILPPSIWPFAGSMAALVMAVGAILWMHSMDTSGIVFYAGTAGVIGTMYGWWSQVVKEAHAGDHTPVVQLHLRYGMILFIASEVMFFVGWFWAWFDFSLFPSTADVIGGVWPPKGVEVLNAFFNHADACAAKHGVEKVKTIGDAYLAIAGGNVTSGNSADAAIAFARDVLEGVAALQAVAGTDVGLRVGIHSGPVVGGVIGATRMAYDYWGETVNMAARLEGTAPVNGIAISESTWLRAKDRAAFGPPHNEMLKGVGETCVYHAGPAPERSALPEISWVA